MQTATRRKPIVLRLLAVVMAIAVTFTMMPLDKSIRAYAGEGLETQTPALLVTGQGLLSDGKYSADNVSKEKSYTLNELKNLGDGKTVTGQMYSARGSQDPFTRSYVIVDGVKISALVDNLSNVKDAVHIIAKDGYDVSFVDGATYTNDREIKNKPGLNSGRYFYDGFDSDNPTAEVPAVISWAFGETEGNNGNPPTSKPTATSEKDYLRLFVGQYNQLDSKGEGKADDMNQRLFNGNKASTTVNKVQVGNKIEEIVLTVDGEDYKRSDVLMMDFAEKSYTYTTSSGEKTDAVRGVPFSVLLADADDNAEVTFEAANGYDMSSATKTKKQLVDGNYMLAYEVNGNGVYSTAKNDATKYGFLTMYGDGDKPSKMINKVTVGGGSDIDFSKSPYKHVTNGGLSGQDGPYNIDSITGATLTIEGPGVKTSVPLSVRDLETRTKGCVRSTYDDTRSGAKATRTYEGIDLYYLLHNMNTGSNGIVLTDKAYQVKIKNRNRNTIATLTLDQIEEMHNGDKPALVSYGTGNEDGTNPRPFVFDGATGADKVLGNEDGCLKFVYDLDKYGDQNGKYSKFGNMAYIYVEEQEAPGFKHTKEGSPYNVVDNTEAIISFTGDTLGREVNYTVKDIEDLVEYKEDGTVDESNGYGYRDNYSLTNTTYWYVNEYEGVKLWSMLLRSGLDPELANDDTTKINYLTSDNYSGTDKFTIKQTANDELFGFYEKNALDNNDGKYEPNENIRKDNDPSTGDKLAVGYPVLLAYGVNSYPYVVSSKLDGYLSGLSNDGGPLRVISGKTNYKHNNGSSQAQKFSGVVVGSNNYHYATHKYHSEKAYKDLADNELTVNINTVKGGETKTTTKKYTIGDIEDINYDGKLTPTKLKEAKVKAKYTVGQYPDLYEGVNLSYFLKDVVELTGSEGTITFKGADNSEKTLSLSDVLTWDQGYCADSGLNNLVPVLAYGKNGMPLVEAKTSEGFVSTETLAEGTKFENKLTIKNQNGPLQVIFPGSKNGEVEAQNIKNVVSIDINLSSDKYAHVETPYDTYADNEITVSGEGTKLTDAKKFTVAELEGKQTLAGTYDYSILKSSGSTSTARYRGIRLYDFLKSTNVGLKSNADKVIVKTRDGMNKEFSMAEIIKTDYINTEDSSVTELPVILAYGSAATDNADRKDGKPLVTNKTGDSSEGYNAAYGNSGGPLKLVIGQADKDTQNSGLCMSDVVSIEVAASAVTNWNHSSSSTFASYLDNKVTFEAVDSDNKTLFTKEYTVKELEAMDSLITRATLHLENDNEWEGLDLWGLIQSVMGDVKGIDNPVNVYVYSRDGFNYNVMEQGLDALKNGVKEGNDYLPILLAYGCDGYPLAQFGKNDPAGPGYDSTIGNGNGPFRAVIHNANGKSAGNVTRILVKVGEAGPVVETPDFKVSGVENGDLTVADLKKLDPTEKEYTVKGETEKARGVLLKDLFESLGVTDKDATFRIDAGGYAGDGTYNDISLKDAIDQDYLVAYEEFADGEWKAINDTSKTPNSKVRIYRNYMEAHPEADQSKWYNKCQFLSGITVSVPQKTVFDVYEGTSQPGDLPLAGIRSTAMDKDGNLWVGTYGGGASYKAKGSDKFVTYNKASEPALNSATVSAVCPDGNSGVWMTQNSSYTDGTLNSGVAYMKDGAVKYYRASDDPATIPNDYVQEIKIDKNGNVWFGSFGGLTKYDPKAGTWQTWDAKDGFPAMSIDNIEFDSKGGIWCGFYPESEATDGSKPFKGGFAYFKDGSIKSYGYESKADDNTGAYRLGDVWVRDIAVDKNGAAWVVASGSYGGMKNTGGKVWYVSEPGAVPQEYTGFDLFGEDNFSTDSELRMVTVAPDGGLWFGTSKDGVFRVDDPTVVGGILTLTDKYSSATGSWHEGYDNIYSLDFYGDTLYAGSSAGLATHKFDFNTPEPPATDEFGDAVDNKDAADLTITGDALERSGYFTIKGIKNWEGVNKVDATFHTLNSTGTEEDIVVQGVTLENLISLAGLADGVELDSVEIVSKDGRTTTYTAEQALNEDLKGNKAMFIWKEGDNKPQKVVRGQFSADDTNKGDWAKDANKIIFHKKVAVEPVGDATADTADITITGDALATDGYFTIKGIKNWEGVNKVDATFHTLNSSGTEEDIAVQGVTLENLISIIGLADGAEVDSVEIVSKDGRTTTYTAEQALNEDLKGNKAMFIWKEGDTKPQKVVRGQFSETDKNKGAWAKDVVKIVVNAKTNMTAVEEVIDAISKLPDTSKLSADTSKEEFEAVSEKISAAREMYEALTSSGKAEVSNYETLQKAENELEAAVKAKYIKDGLKAIDEIKYSDYGANAFGVFIDMMRLKSKLENGESMTASEVKALYDRITEEIETKTTSYQKTQALKDYPVNAKVTARAYNSVALSWGDVPSAESFEIRRSTDPQAEKYDLIGVSTTKAYTDNTVQPGIVYYYKVVARAKADDKFVYGDESNEAANIHAVKTSLNAPKLKKATRGKKKATLKWSATAGASGYQIYYKKAKTAAEYTTAGASATKKVVKKLKKKKKYTFKIRAYRIVDGKYVYGGWSNAKKAKIK